MSACSVQLLLRWTGGHVGRLGRDGDGDNEELQ
jgi:hypothetical protein